MPVWKRFNGKKVNRGDANYSLGTWIAEGSINGQKYKKSLKLAKTKEDAAKEEDKIRASILQGDYDFIFDKTKFSDFVDTVYLPYAKDKNDSYSVKLTETKHLKAFFKQMPLRQITVAQCDKFKRTRKLDNVRCQKCAHKIEHDCIKKPVSTETVNRELATLSKILNLACRDRKIKDNPMRYVEKFTKAESRERFLTITEKDNLLSEIMANKQLFAIVLIGLLTGWRKGQILSLCASAMDSETRTVRIIKSKKTKARRVVVSDAVWQILEVLAKESKSDWLFYNQRSKTHLKDFAKSWKSALSKAGIADFRFHDIRRSAATELLRYGTDAFTIKAVLGHSDINMTSIYARPQDEMMREALNKIGENYEGYIN